MQSAPVEDNIVVSDIGEQWSPNTDPPSVAARVTIIIEGLVAIIGSQIIITIGIKIPKVPHAVPIENDKNEATINTIKGKNITGKWLCCTKLPIY